MRKLVRAAARAKRYVASCLRVAVLKAKFPDLVIDRRSYVGPGCQISCSLGGKLIIAGSHIAQGCTVVAESPAQLRISGSSLGPSSVVVARERIEICEGCAIAEMVVIRDQDHEVDPDRGVRLADAKFHTAPIEIGPGCWIGAKATILRGSKIGAHAVIGAHSVVRGLVEADAVYAGAPAARVG